MSPRRCRGCSSGIRGMDSLVMLVDSGQVPNLPRCGCIHGQGLRIAPQSFDLDH